jgi:hypothetical protein
MLLELARYGNASDFLARNKGKIALKQKLEWLD